MTKSLNFGLKIKERYGGWHTRSPPTLPPPPPSPAHTPQKNVKRALGLCVCVFRVGPTFLRFSRVCRGWLFENNRLILLQTEGN